MVKTDIGPGVFTNLRLGSFIQNFTYIYIVRRRGIEPATFCNRRTFIYCVREVVQNVRKRNDFQRFILKNDRS